MSQPIGSLLGALVGRPRRPGAFSLRRRPAGGRRNAPTLLATEPLEARSMLALSIGIVGGTLQVTQDVLNPGEAVGVVLASSTVPGPTPPGTPVQATGLRIVGNTAGGSAINTGVFIPFNDAITGLPNINGVSIALVDTTSQLTIMDQLTAITNVSGGPPAWSATYNVAGGATASNTASGAITITTPSRLAVTTDATVQIDGDFTANDGRLAVSPAAAVVGKTTAVSGNDVTITTAGANAITFLRGLTGTNSVTLNTAAALTVAQNILAPSLVLNVPGVTQTGGAVTATNFTLTTTGSATFPNAANAIANLTAINAAGQDVVLKTTGTVGQTGAILARSLRLEATGAVTLTNALNDVDQLGISSSGAIQYVDFDEVQLGVGTLGVQALGGNAVTLTMAGDLTQGAAGRVVAGTFTATINNPLAGNANLLLNSANNQVSTFVATNDSAGGRITFSNTPVAGVLQLGDGTAGGGITATNGPISITNGTGITIASPVSAGTLGTIALTSTGGISQNFGATLLARDLTVVNRDTTGAITLDLLNDIRNVAITSGATNGDGVTFKGNNAASASLAIFGTGISAQGGTVTIDSDTRKLQINAGGITVAGGGDVVLETQNGITQAAAAPIVANNLTVTNGTAGVVTLQSPANNVTNLAITNNVTSGEVLYTDLNDLSLTAGGGIVAGDSITLNVGGGFTSTAGNVLNVTGATGTVSLTTTKAATIGGAITAQSGATITSGAAVALNAALAGGAGLVTVTAKAGDLTTNAAGTIAGNAVSLAGSTGVSLAAAVTAATGGITVASTGGGLLTDAAAVLTAAGSITSTTTGSASFDGTVTGKSIVVTAGTGEVKSDIDVSGAFLATGGPITLSATDAIATTATLTGNSVTGKSGGTTSVGGAVNAAAGVVSFDADGGFTTTNAAADITATGGVGVSSTAGSISLAGGATGATVALEAATGVSLNESIKATAGTLTITATGGSVGTVPGAKLDAKTTATISGSTGVALADSVTAANVIVTATGGKVEVHDVTAAAGTVSLTAANGISQVGGTAITAVTLATSNTATGAITLDEAANAVSKFGATNKAAGGAVFFENTLGLTITGVTTTNGLVDIVNGGGILLAGGINAGTADISLDAAGTVGQAITAAVVGANLYVTTTGGDVVLDSSATNDVDFLWGANGAAGGVFRFSDADGLTIASPTKALTTNDGDISIWAGRLGPGALTIGGNVDAGTGQIDFKAAGGITQTPGSWGVTSDTGLSLTNNTSGNISLPNLAFNSFPSLSAVSPTGTSIAVQDNKDLQFVGLGVVAPGGAVSLTVNGQVTQAGTAPLSTGSATIVSTGSVDLQALINDVANLAINTTGTGATIDYIDVNDLTIGVGADGVESSQGDITVTSLLGAITLNNDVTTNGQVDLAGEPLAVTLTANGSITQTAGAVATGDLIMWSKGGDIRVEQTNNAIANLRARAAASLRYVNAATFEVGLNRTPLDPIPAGTTLTVATGVATFSNPFTVDVPDPFTGISVPRALINGDVVVIGGVPYRATAVTATTATLLSPDGVPLDVLVPTPFQVLTPQYLELIGSTVNLNAVGGNLRVTASVAGAMTFTAGGVVQYVVSSTENALRGSLRQMINYVNANLGTRTVGGVTRPQPMQMVFDEADYPVQDIFLSTQLPAITKPVDIIGTQVEANVTDFARVGVDGSGIGLTSIVNGLIYGAGSAGSTTTGMSVYGFATGAGVQVISGVNTFTNNYVGLRRDGITVATNKIGIELTGRTSTSNTIGTYIADEALANVIGGNAFAGIVVRNGATANAIVGNYIGTNALDNDLIGNLGDGVVLEGVNGNLVGARSAVLPDGTPAASNVIAYNNNSGVRIVGARAATVALGNLVENNVIRDNAVNGVDIVASSFQSVGGIQPRQSNVILGQKTGSGVRIAQSADVSVIANYIGVDQVGSANTETNTYGNTVAGVLVDGSVRTIINSGNRIGNNGTGVFIRNGATATRVEGNYIGTNELGTEVGNLGDGVAIDRSIGNFVRLGNTIANNKASGVNVTDALAATLGAGNIVSGNTIRANTTGVRIAGGARTTVGGAGVGNVIAANTGDGILVTRSAFTGSSVGVAIQGNFVGTSPLGEVDPTLGNDVGIRLQQASGATVDGGNVVTNSRSGGIRIEGSVSTVIGSSTAGLGNVVTRNSGDGVTITSAVGKSTVSNNGNNVFGNTITANTGSGIVVKGTTTGGISTTSGVVVGVRAIPGLALAGRANVIESNGAPGVVVDGAQGVSIAGNQITGNTTAAIDLMNDGNLGAVMPTITSAVVVQRSGAGQQVVVQGTLDLPPSLGAGVVSQVVNGVAVFSLPQSFAPNSVITINGQTYTVAGVVSGTGNTQYRLLGNPTIAAAGLGRVSVNRGVASFSVAQLASTPGAVKAGNTIVVAGRLYTVSSVAADGRTGRIAGNPSFLVSNFSILRQNLTFTVPNGLALNQQYVVDLYLNNPGDGDPASGLGYQARTFLGRAPVTIGATGPAAFTATVPLPAGQVPVGQFITATSTTIRSKPGAITPFATSEVSSGRQLMLSGPAVAAFAALAEASTGTTSKKTLTVR